MGTMRSTSSAGTPRRSSAIFIARAEPGAGLDRLDHVPAIGGRAVADDLGIDLAPRAPARLEVLEEQRPGALAEHEAVAGRVERAGHRRDRLARARQAHAAHVREAGVRDLEEEGSVGTEMTAMQSPRRIASAASPTLWVPVAQADTMHTLWPIAPVSMASSRTCCRSGRSR